MSILVVALLQSHRLLRVGALPAAGAVLAEPGPLHGRGGGGGDTETLTLVQTHLVLTGPDQLLALAVLLLHQVQGGGQGLAGVLELRHDWDEEGGEQEERVKGRHGWEGELEWRLQAVR